MVRTSFLLQKDLRQYPYPAKTKALENVDFWENGMGRSDSDDRAGNNSETLDTKTYVRRYLSMVEHNVRTSVFSVKRQKTVHHTTRLDVTM